MLTIAVQDDKYGPNDAAAPIWHRVIEERGHRVKAVDVFAPDIMKQVEGCDGFMWRFAHFPHLLQIARRVMPLVERVLGIPVYPDWNTAWHYDDKIAQAFLLKHHGIPVPETWVWFDRDRARAWADTAPYPVVLKLAGGAGSSNVVLVKDRGAARRWIDRLFLKGAHHLAWDPVGTKLILAARTIRAFAPFLQGRAIRFSQAADTTWVRHKGYALFQEFVPDNKNDTRVTVVGDRAFAYRRFNRPGDFRASGSGNFNTDPEAIDPDAIRLAFSVAAKLNTQSLAHDILRKPDGTLVINEVSYTYVSWMVHQCPGHWDREMRWHDGSMWPEEAQAIDFLERLLSRDSTAG